MKTLFLCGQGANQKALACRLDSRIGLSAIAEISSPRGNGTPFLRRVMLLVAGYPLRDAWAALFRRYLSEYPDYPSVPLTRFDDVVGAEFLRFIDKENFELVIVSGTPMIPKQSIARMSRNGKLLNLHTGISPYIKGGPNCTNWALALRRPDLIGNTVMWLGQGIDSGNIIATERTPLTGDEGLRELHRKVMDHAHDLYCRCAAALTSGAPIPSIPQKQLEPGKTFYNKDWTPAAAARAVVGFFAHYRRRVRAPTGREVVFPLLVADSSQRYERPDLGGTSQS